MLPNFAYIRPKTLKAAIKQASSDGARVHAGGIDLLVCLRDGVFDATKVVSISGLKELKGIKETSNGGLSIGAMTTITEVAENAVIKERYAALAQGAAQVASPQLRHQGTIGGNICQKPWCWYYRADYNCSRKGGDTCFAAAGQNQYHCIFGGVGCVIVHPSDTAPALVALNATVNIAGPGGNRKVPMEKFHVPPSVDVTKETVLEPGEIVTAITIPAPPAGLKSSYRKVAVRRAWDFALAGVALALQMEGGTVKAGRVVLSGAAPVPWRSQEAEKAITGKKLDAKTAAAAAQAAVKKAEPLEYNEYKVALFRGVIEEALLAIA
jgi:xanthine dehydrogenase YagS FAD-binding subunit